MRILYEFKLIAAGMYKEVQTPIPEPRPEGYYWVKYQGKWEIAEWVRIEDCNKVKFMWVCLGDIGGLSDEHFDRIYEFKIEPPRI